MVIVEEEAATSDEEMEFVSMPGEHKEGNLEGKVRESAIRCRRRRIRQTSERRRCHPSHPSSNLSRAHAGRELALDSQVRASPSIRLRPHRPASSEAVTAMG